MAAADTEFASLIERARGQDREAMEALCEKYEAKVRVVARVLLGPALRPHLDSVDLVQSVHRTLMLGLQDDKYDISSPEKLIALATTIVRRKVARHWRKLQRQHRLSTGATADATLPELLTNLSSTETDPARAADFRDQVEQLCQCLSDVELQILRARADGYTTAEIADQLGINHTTLRVRMTRLRERLRTGGVCNHWL